MLNLNWNIIWTFVNLIILYILLRKFLFGPITAMMEKREGEIKSSLDNASAAKQEAAALKAAYTDKLKTAEAAAGDIIKSAKEEAKAKRDEIISKAKEDAGNIVLNANKQIELEKERSISEAKSEIASLVMDAALKAAQTELRAFFPPPTETNFAGGLLAGSRSACAAAAAAFAQTVEEVAARPIN